MIAILDGKANSTRQLLSGQLGEEEVESPIGNTERVFNSLTRELTMLFPVEIEKGGCPPWDRFGRSVEFAVLQRAASIGYCLFHFCWVLHQSRSRTQLLRLEKKLSIYPVI